MKLGVVFAIIGILAAVVLVSLNSARAKSRDAKRLADVRQVQTALELFYNDNGSYPSESSNAALGTDGATNYEFSTYLTAWPTAPTPQDNPSGGSTCTTANNIYDYNATGTDPTTYSVVFCLGGITGGYAAGLHTASPSGIQ